MSGWLSYDKHVLRQVEKNLISSIKYLNYNTSYYANHVIKAATIIYIYFMSPQSVSCGVNV